MKDLTTTPRGARHLDDNVHAVANNSTPTAAPGALLVDFDGIVSTDRKPFDETRLGATVTATVTVRSVNVLAGGHARGIVDGEGGYAVFYVPRGVMSVLRYVLTAGATVRIRGSHDLVGMLPTITVFAARQVDA